jgi:multisubunit Na+/H+ antiporter MnhE subunit
MAAASNSTTDGRSIWGLLWDSIKTANAVAGGIFGVAIAFLLWAVVPDSLVHVWKIVPIGLFTIVLIWVLADALVTAVRLLRQAPSTQVVAVKTADAPYRHTKCVILVRWS